jgi:hypothetical protein
MNYRFQGVDETTNVAKFSSLTDSKAIFMIPLDFIRSVWRDEKECWHITGVEKLSA